MVLKKATINKNRGRFSSFLYIRIPLGAFKNCGSPGLSPDICFQLAEVGPRHTVVKDRSRDADWGDINIYVVPDAMGMEESIR